jgi:nucleotide-binding universal stress UspA family protein
VSATIVVGVDESTGAREALRWAVAEGAVREAQVVAVLAWGFLDQHTDALEGFNPDYGESDADAALGRMIEDALGPESARDVRRHIVCDLPARALLDTAANADMLVIGARGVGGFAGLLLGSVSQHCVHHATIPTVVVRDRADAAASGVIVGVDGSEHAERALAWAADEARRRRAPLTVVHGYQVPPIGGFPYTTMTMDSSLMPRAARQLLKRALDRIDTSGIEVNPVSSPAGGARAVLESAESAALVVVGSRGLGAFKRLLLGSAATQVVNHAPCPVAVIPARD